MKKYFTSSQAQQQQQQQFGKKSKSKMKKKKKKSQLSEKWMEKVRRCSWHLEDKEKEKKKEGNTT